MGRNEIKLRRQLATDDIQRYRNYSELLEKHERIRRHRRTLKFFLYTLVVTVVIVLFLIVVSYLVIRLEKQQEQKRKGYVRTSGVI